MTTPLEVRLSGGQVGHGLHVYVADRLVLRYDGGFVESLETLDAEIHAARAAQTGVMFLRRLLADLRAEARPDGGGGTEAQRKASFAEGLEAALILEVPGRRLTGAPVLPPEHKAAGRRSFEEGWKLGDALRRIVEIVAAQESEREGTVAS